MNVTVRHGDNMWAIAHAHGVSLKALIAANPQIKNPRFIHAGQTIHIPGDGFVAPKPKPKPVGSLPATTAHEYQAFALKHPESIFKTQYRGIFNPTGPWRSGNCGPASLAMAIKAYGLEPDGLTPEQSIDRAHKLMNGSTNDHSASNDHEREHGAIRAGLHTKHLSNMSHLDRELNAGHMIMLTGRPVGDYRRAFPRYSHFSGFHSILVAGRTKDGHYIVCDPLSHYGPRKMTDAQLSAFWSQGGGSGSAVWR